MVPQLESDRRMLAQKDAADRELAQEAAFQYILTQK
jgi:hypothetical protein